MLRLKYVGIAVTDIEDAIKTYEKFFGMKQMTPIKKARWGFLNCMMGDGIQAYVELMQPVDENGALARFMRDNVGPGNPDGQGVYHVGWDTDDLAGTKASVEAGGGRTTVVDGVPGVMWVHPLSLRNAFFEIETAGNRERPADS